MATISTLAYKIVADTQNFLQGVKLSRTEMKAAQQVFRDSIDPVTAYKAELDALAQLHAKGALTADQYAAAVARTAQRSDPAIIAQREAEAVATQQAADAAKQRDAVLQSGLALSQSLATPEEQRAMRLKEAKDLLDQNAISQEDFNRAVRQLDTEKYQQAHDRLKGIGDSLTTAGTQMMAVGAGITAAFGGTAYAAINAAAEYEQTTIAFTTLMGSASAAQQTLEDLTNFAAATPFQMPELQTVARGLLGFGITGKDLIEQIRIMGDAAAATNAPLGELGQIFVKIRGAGKLMGDTFNQLSERGIMFHKDIAAHFGIAESEVAKFISAGKVGFADVEAIMRSLTSEGGRYNDAVKAQSESAMGLASTLKDNVAIALRGVGQELLPMAKAVTGWGIGMANSLTQLDSGTKKTIAYTTALGVAVGGVLTVSGLVVVATGKVVTWYAAATLAASKYAAANWALAAAGAAAKVAMGGFAVAVAGVVGYQLGKWLQEVTESGRTAAGVLGNLRDEAASLAGLDMAGTSRESLEQYIASTERQIAKTKEHNDQLQAGQAWWNLWGKNKDVIDANQQRVDALGTSLNAAKKELAAMSGAEVGATGDTGPSEQVLAAADKYVESLRLQNATFGYTTEQAKLYQMQLDGVPPATIALAAAEMKRAEALKAGQKAADEQMEKFRQSQEDYRKQRESIAATIAAYEQQTIHMQLSGDALESYKLAQAGATEAELAQLAALQAQRAAVQSQLDEATAARQRQEALRGDLDETTARLREQIATYGMTADEIERYRLSQAGASADELAAIKDLQDQLAALQAQKDAMRASDTTIGAGSLADAYDAIQRAQEAMTVTPPAIVDRYAGYGPSVPVDMPMATTTSLAELETPAAMQSTWDMILGAEQSAQVPLLERIATGIDAIARREGIVIEEVQGV